MTDVAEVAVAAPARRPPGHLSPSSARLLGQCPRRFEFQKVLGVREAPGPAAVLGTTVHKVWELLSGVPKGLRRQLVALRILDEVWGLLVPDDAAREPSFVEPSDPDVVDLVHDFRGLRLEGDALSRFYRQAWEDIEYVTESEPVVASGDVAHRELPLETEVGGVPFKGRADRVDRCPDGLEVVDLKSGKGPFDGDGRVIRPRLADVADQLLLYAPAVESVTRQRVVACVLFYVGESGRGWVPVSLSGVAGAVARFGEAWARFQHFEASGSYPPKPSKLCCWCPHFEACPEGSAMVLSLRDYQRVWESDNGRPTTARAMINGWPLLRRRQWSDRAQAAWPLLQQALAR